MVSTAGLIILLIGVIFVASMFGAGAETGKEIKKDLKEQQEKVADQPDSNLGETGNIAKDIDAEVCSLNVRWVGLITDDRPFDVVSEFTDENYLWMGEQGFLAFNDVSNTNVREYQWFCDFDNPLSFFAFSFTEPRQFAFLDSGELGDSETIRIKWIARSIDNLDKVMFDANGRGEPDKPFQQSIRIPAGTQLPFNWVIEDRFEAVTHDDYEMEYWSDGHRINDEDIGHRFHVTLCEVGKSNC